jgi:polar amino acid transport system substrate-binding protein
VTVVSSVDDEVIADLVPGGVLRAAINLGNPVLAQGTAAAPAGVTPASASWPSSRPGRPRLPSPPRTW